jgi:hypothetical protein
MTKKKLSVFRTSGFILLCASIFACGGAPEPDEVGRSAEELGVGAGDPPMSGDPGEHRPPPTACVDPNPACSVQPVVGWDPNELQQMRAHGCEPPFRYNTGAGAGIIAGTLSVCVDNPRARAFVESHHGSWAPAGFCDRCLERLPHATKYVVWSWAIGPNCSGCSVGVPPWS